MTLLSIYVLGNIHLSQTVGGMSPSRKGNSPYPPGSRGVSRNVLNTLHVCISVFFPTLKTFLIKPIFCRYFVKVLVVTSSAVVNKGYIEGLLSYQNVLISRAKFSFFVISSVSVLGRLWVNGTTVSITSAVLFCLSMSTISGLLKSVFISVMIDLSQNKTTLADCSTGSDPVSTVRHNTLNNITICWRTIFASWLCLPRYAFSDSDKHQAIMTSIVSPTLSHALLLSITSTPKQCFS